MAAVAAAGLVALSGLPRSLVKARMQRVDMVGGVLFVPAIAAVLYAITRSPEWGWLDLRTGSLLLASAILLVLWVRYELRHPCPLIDVRLLAQPQIALANIAFALIAVGAMQLGLVLFPFLQQPLWTGVGLGLTATLSGIVKLPSNLIAVIGGTWSGAMAARRGARVPMLIGTGLLTASWAALAMYHDSLWFIIGATIVAGLGMSMSYAAVPNLIVEVAPPERTSEATGVSTITRAAAHGGGGTAGRAHDGLEHHLRPCAWPWYFPHRAKLSARDRLHRGLLVPGVPRQLALAQTHTRLCRRRRGSEGCFIGSLVSPTRFAQESPSSPASH